MSPEPSPLALYWEERAQQFAARGPGLAAVCSYGMPAFYNRYVQACQRRALSPWLARNRGSALDVGCGVGRWLQVLLEYGNEVSGIDLSPTMVERARALVGEREDGKRCTLLVSDATTLELGRQFDVIVCVTVIQHIVDPARAQQALERLAGHLKPSGELILLEAAPQRATTRCNTPTFHARSALWYRQMLRQAGLRVVAERGVDPMPFKTWLLPHYRRLPKPLATLALALVTALSWPLDLLLAPALTDRSWHKVFLLHHDKAPR